MASASLRESTWASAISRMPWRYRLNSAEIVPTPGAISTTGKIPPKQVSLSLSLSHKERPRSRRTNESPNRRSRLQRQSHRDLPSPAPPSHAIQYISLPSHFSHPTKERETHIECPISVTSSNPLRSMNLATSPARSSYDACGECGLSPWFRKSCFPSRFRARQPQLSSCLLPSSSHRARSRNARERERRVRAYSPSPWPKSASSTPHRFHGRQRLARGEDGAGVGTDLFRSVEAVEDDDGAGRRRVTPGGVIGVGGEVKDRTGGGR